MQEAPLRAQQTSASDWGPVLTEPARTARAHVLRAALAHRRCCSACLRVCAGTIASFRQVDTLPAALMAPTLVSLPAVPAGSAPACTQLPCLHTSGLACTPMLQQTLPCCSRRLRCAGEIPAALHMLSERRRHLAADRQQSDQTDVQAWVTVAAALNYEIVRLNSHGPSLK